MSLRLRLAGIGLPGPLRRKEIRRLAERTARAFEVPAPRLGKGPVAAAWLAFARFTQEQASRLPRDEASRLAVRERLRREAEAMGRDLGRRLGVRSRPDVLRAARILYRAMGIDLVPEPDGRIRVASCSCASIYTPDTCRTIAALDEGLLSGLAGGGRLTFSARLTEGAPACAARFEFPGEKP